MKRDAVLRFRTSHRLMGVLVAAGALAGCLPGLGPPQPKLVAVAVRRGDLTLDVTATGNLEATHEIEVGSEISGKVTQVLVDANDRVVGGQVMAVIDAARLQDAVRQAQAQLAANAASVGQAQAALDEARAQLDRLHVVQSLSGGQVPSASEMTTQEASVNKALANLAAARANVTAASAALSSDRTEMARAVIRAPQAGVVLSRTVEPGQTVQAAFATPSLFLLAEDLRRMKLEVAVDEADVGQVREGQDASFTVDAFPGQTFAARIRRVNLGAKTTTGSAAASSSTVVSYTTLLDVSNDDLRLRPGMTATTTIHAARLRDALLVPSAALRFTPPAAPGSGDASGLRIAPPDAGHSSVEQQRTVGPGSLQVLYVLQARGRVRRVPVRVGRSAAGWTAVQPEPGAALAVGEQVAVGVQAASHG